jgi:hypothetical protein
MAPMAAATVDDRPSPECDLSLDESYATELNHAGTVSTQPRSVKDLAEKITKGARA